LDAISYGEKAISVITPDDHYAPSFFGNLAQAYGKKWAKSQADEDLEAATKNSAECVRMTPKDSAYRAHQLLNYRSLLMAQVIAHDTTIGHHNVDEPLHHFKEAAELPNGVPLARITAARNAIRILWELEDWDNAKSLD
jgi:hypothetical protein